jgi:glutamyl-tRNA synthetase
MPVRTRFAPSPTGYLHIGGARTALFSWLYARHNGGDFILRVEDTDRERFSEESVQAILDGIAWLGLSVDEGPIFQSDRFDRYDQVIDQLLDDKKAYRCYCSREELDRVREEQRQHGLKPRYNRRCRDAVESKRSEESPVIRFRNPLEGSVLFEDQVRGRVTINNDELDDLVIARAGGTPTYNFTNVVDDIDMRITNVIRGDDHINNTPRQINMFEALGALPPSYAHVPMIVGTDGQRLSKRHGAVSVLQYRDDGFLPEALRNYLVRLGWSHGDQEIFSLEEMIEKFDISNVNRAASAFDLNKLCWLNQHYIKNADNTRLSLMLGQRLHEHGVKIKDGPSLSAVVDTLRERAQTVEELAEKSHYFFHDFEAFEESAAKKYLRPVTASILEDLLDRLRLITDWRANVIHDAINDTAKSHGLKLGKIAQPLRVAVSGTSATPPIDQTVELVGRAKTLERIEHALRYISERTSVGA